MSNFLTCAWLMEKYGLRLNIKQLAEALGVSVSTITNQLAERRFPIPSYKDVGGVRFDYRDVAEYLDTMRDRARDAVAA